MSDFGLDNNKVDRDILRWSVSLQDFQLGSKNLSIYKQVLREVLDYTIDNLKDKNFSKDIKEALLLLRKIRLRVDYDSDIIDPNGSIDRHRSFLENLYKESEDLRIEDREELIKSVKELFKLYRSSYEYSRQAEILKAKLDNRLDKFESDKFMENVDYK